MDNQKLARLIKRVVRLSTAERSSMDQELCDLGIDDTIVRFLAYSDGGAGELAAYLEEMAVEMTPASRQNTLDLVNRL